MRKKKKRITVYSDEDGYDDGFDRETLPPARQHLALHIEKKHRGGKVVTLIRGFIGQDEDLKTLALQLKKHCGVGGTVKNAEIVLQGNIRDKAITFLAQTGYNVKAVGG